MVRTANGVVPVQRARAALLEVGTIKRRNLAVHMSDAFGPMNVLGMNFLSSLSGWGVEGQYLILRP
jgi:aspartyl protease family protein